MTHLGKRVDRLEAGNPSDQLLIAAYAPAAWPHDERTSAVAELATARGLEEPYRIDLMDGPDVEILFAMTGRELDDVLAEVGRTAHLNRIGVPQ